MPEPECLWCETHPDAACPACSGRRRRAVRLVGAEGLTVERAAARMGVSAQRVERLLEEDADRRRLESFRGDHVDNAELRRLLAERQRSEPSLTVAELARRLSTSQAQLERWLGLRLTARKAAGGRVYGAHVVQRVGVDVAGRIVRALGYAPCEVEGC